MNVQLFWLLFLLKLSTVCLPISRAALLQVSLASPVKSLSVNLYLCAHILVYTSVHRRWINWKTCHKQFYEKHVSILRPKRDIKCICKVKINLCLKRSSSTRHKAKCATHIMKNNIQKDLSSWLKLLEEVSGQYIVY